MSRRYPERIERLPGPGAASSYVVDIEGSRSIENAETMATILLRIWPDVCLRIATAWRPETEEVE